MVRDLVIIEESVKQLESDSAILLENHYKYSDIILETQADLISCWECLRQNSDQRGLALSESQKFQRFLRDSSDILSWIADMQQLIEGDSEPSTLPDATSLLERILEYEGEFTARNASFLDTIAFGNSLITSHHSETLLTNSINLNTKNFTSKRKMV
ncbi:hypothetical protein LOD99_10988 [Oopsacas minuta]|uniref:Uncharacterized protein n=1 Tax=Oopsacas minuta TaxID=111878 RepID=A0AAV7KBX5_9METZ|nr:hypothetical protein LOD99_10988 [Oopsacas minuta]